MFLAVLGTRPEAIKFGPVLRALRRRGCEVLVLSTGQHTDLLAQTHLPIDHTLTILHDPNPIIYGERVATATRQWLLENATVDRKLQGVMVVGDTASAWGGAIGAYDAGYPVAHIEAGVRSHDMANPWPEEGFRVEIDRIARWHFCPTEGNAANLESERRGAGPYPRFLRLLNICNTHVVGNPGIDTLYQNQTPIPVNLRGPTVLVTLHRRESWGEPMRQILQGINAVAKSRKDLQFILPCHPNGHAEKAANDCRFLTLTSPMPPEGFQQLLARCQAVVTDSGGVQEEAAALGIPCVVAREVTDRPESVLSGHAILATRSARAVQEAVETALSGVLRTIQFLGFGDGKASQRIAEILVP